MHPLSADRSAAAAATSIPHHHRSSARLAIAASFFTFSITVCSQKRLATKSKSLAASNRPRPAAFLLSAASSISLFAAHANARGASSGVCVFASGYLFITSGT
jgi:hypothetical protein